MVVLHGKDAVRLDQLMNLHARSRVKHLEAKHLDAARGPAGTAADKHQHGKGRQGETAPTAKIGRGIAGAGQYRNGIESGVTHRIVHRHAARQPEPARQRQQRDQYDTHKPSHLRIAPQALGAAAHGLQIEHKRQRPQYHEDDGNGFDRRIVEQSQGSVRRRIAARGDGRHAVANGLESGHTGQPVGNRIDHGQRQIHQEDGTSELHRAWQHAL